MAALGLAVARALAAAERRLQLHVVAAAVDGHDARPQARGPLGQRSPGRGRRARRRGRRGRRRPPPTPLRASAKRSSATTGAKSSSRAQHVRRRPTAASAAKAAGCSGAEAAASTRAPAAPRRPRGPRPPRWLRGDQRPDVRGRVARVADPQRREASPAGRAAARRRPASTSTRRVAVHFWPASAVAHATMQSAARSRSASASTTAGLMPLSSSAARGSRSAARAGRRPRSP